MRRYAAKRRDKCEPVIVAALKSAGAVVERLDGKGLPDLLVGFRGRTFLIECKDPDDGARNSRGRSGRKVENELGLRESQWDWWQAWKGERPVLVTSPSEALCAIGVHDRRDEPGEPCAACGNYNLVRRMVGEGVFR